MRQPAIPAAASTATCPAAGADDAAPGQARRLLALLREGDLDAAIQAGLMDIDPGASGLAPGEAALLHDARVRLQAAWAARDRHRQREARLLHRAAERARRDGVVPAAPVDHGHAGTAPSLPPAAAAALARARARAAGRR